MTCVSGGVGPRRSWEPPNPPGAEVAAWVLAAELEVWKQRDGPRRGARRRHRRRRRRWTEAKWKHTVVVVPEHGRFVEGEQFYPL